jgi:hypothetical protein
MAVLVVAAGARAGAQEVLHRTDAYTVLSDRVRQGAFEAVAKSRTEMTSSYRRAFDTKLQIGFKINGNLGDIATYDYNSLLFSSKHGKVVSPVYVFGERESNDDVGRGSGRKRDGTTMVTLRLDMRPVLGAFAKQGYYQFENMKRITPGEFKGVYLTGDAARLVQAFPTLPPPERFRLTDRDGDGIYEITVPVKARKVPGENKPALGSWKLQEDISDLPQYQSPQVLVDALYALSLEEMLLDIDPDGAFLAGKLWGGVWTRDISHSILLSLAAVAPEVSKTSLLRKVNEGRIIQDTGTGGSWPVSTDRTTWGLAAWEVYKVTGDREWLARAYEVLRKSVEADLANVRAPDGLFRGESAFMDWRQQSYPRWMDPKDIYQSECLSTNAVHYQTYRTLAEMARLLGKPDKEYREVADSIKAAINRRLWLPEKGYYGAGLYGRTSLSLSPRSEALGEALTVLFDVADEKQRRLVIANTPVVEFGTPSFFPHTPNLPSYHNNSVWPFVVGHWTWASAKARNGRSVEHGLGSIYRQAALFLTNKENMVAATGDSSGTVINSDRQLWSVAANLGTVYRVFFGMDFEPDRLIFRPFVPKAFKGPRTLSHFKYRNGVLDITVEGHGDEIKSVLLDGKRLASATIPGDITGRHKLVITLADNDLPSSSINKVSNHFAPETPTASLDGSKLSWGAVESAHHYWVYKDGNKIAETTGTSFALDREDRRGGEFQVLAVDAAGFQSFLSEPVEVRTGERIDVEAEAGRDKVEKRYDGYSGTGYLTLSKTENLAVDFTVNVTKPGRYVVRYRYANGNGPLNTENKCAVRTLRLDGRRVGAVVMPQRGFEWNNWGYSNSHLVPLSAGRHTFRVAFEDTDENMNGGINDALLDKMELYRVGD